MIQFKKILLRKIFYRKQTQRTCAPQGYTARAINPNVEKAGGLQSQGVKGEAVLDYREFLTTQDLKSSGFPKG